MKRALYLVLAAVVVAVPALMASALLWHFNQATIFDTLPVQSDEIMYWHQANTFAEAGFNGGYYTTADALPRLGRYFSWGIAAPVFYGSFGAVFGWPLWGIAVINLAILTLAVGAFIALIKPVWLELLGFGIVLALYHPIVLYAPTQYVEILLMAIALILSALFARIIRQRQAGYPPSRSFIAAAGALIFAAALFRLPWSGLFLPLVVLAFNPSGIRQWVTTISGAIALTLPPFVIYTLTAAPYPNYTISRIFERPTVVRAARIFSRNIEANWQQLFEGDPLEIQLRLGTAAACAILTLVLMVRFINSRATGSAQTRFSSKLPLTWFVLTLFFGFLLVVYEMYGFRGYRMLAAPILFTIGLAIAFQWRLVLILFTLYLVTVAPYTLEYYRLFNAFQTNDERREQIDMFSQQYAETIPFNDQASDPWCNTITLDLFYLFGETSVAVAVPAGVGISIPETVWNSGEFPMPPKTHYIGLPTERYDQLRVQLNVKLLFDIPSGAIYLNLDSPCEATIRSGPE